MNMLQMFTYVDLQLFLQKQPLLMTFLLLKMQMVGLHELLAVSVGPT
jgi:hypothetical protein